MLHELGTNAAKHGALSVSAGTVAIRWTVHDRRLKLSWIERNGPPVKAPSRRGFGNTLIERTASGTAQSTFDRDGVRWDIELPLLDQAYTTSTLRNNVSALARKTAAIETPSEN